MLGHQVRFNSERSENNPQCLEWVFLIINHNNREISRITTSIYNLFAPIISEGKSYSGKLKNEFYRLINFDSERRLDSGWKSRIFKRVVKDNNLYNGESDSDGLEKYISEIDKKIKFS